MTDNPESRDHSNRGRFQKGQSGNPGGRPKKAAEQSSYAFDIVIDRTLTVNNNGVERQITMEEALQLKTYQDAVAGKRQAQKLLIKWIEKREAHLAKHRPQPSAPAFVFKGYRQDPDNADEAMVLLGIAKVNPAQAELVMNRAQLLLEPWAVEAAFKRRRNAKPLEDIDIDSIRRCTRDANTIRALSKAGSRNGRRD